MSFMDNTTLVINGQVHFNDDEKNNLIDYLNKCCKEQGCAGEWSLPDNADVDCYDCVVATMYWAMVKLAEWEAKGLTLEEYGKFVKEREQQSKDAELGRAAAEIINKIPSCKGKFGSEICAYVRSVHINKGCHLEEFCRLRAEGDGR